MPFVLDFSVLDKHALPLVGGKNASLGEMIKAGIRVPPGFAVTTDAYIRFIEQAGIQDAILKLLAGVDGEDVSSLDAAAETIRGLIQQTPLISDIQISIEESYEKLCQQCGGGRLPVAVRSSATAEDLPTPSFAGQQYTYLWVQGGAHVATHVQRFWASRFTSRAIA